MLNAKSALSRLQAAHEVAKWGDAKSVESLTRALKKEKFWGAASEMASALGSVRTPAAYAALRGFLAHPNPKVRRAVVQGLAEFKDPDLAKDLAPMARRDPSINVSAEAMRTLGGLRDVRLLPLFKSKLKERSYWDVVKAGAIQGLANLRDPKAIPVLRKMTFPPTTNPARLYAIRALSGYASLSKDIVPWLCEYLEDEDERVTFTAAQALGRIEDERAVAPLEKIRDKTQSVRLKTYADEAIARIRAGSDSDGGKPSKNRPT